MKFSEKLSSIMKKFVIVFLICLFCSKAFARYNVRLNTFGGIGFVTSNDEPFFLMEIPVTLDYEFSVSGLEADTFAFGITGGLLLFPCMLVDFSYIHCLQPKSTKNYRWNLETELHSGFSYLGDFSLNEEGGIDHNDAMYLPTILIDVLFTFKPKVSGFYFGIGPVCDFIFIPKKKDKTNNNYGWCILPSLELSVGYTF